MFKNEKKTKKSPLGGSKKLKSAAYSTAFAAIIIAAVVALNVIVSALGNAFPLSVDMSSGAENSLTEENIKFLKTVKKDVNIYVLSDEDDYKGDYYSYYVNQAYSTSDSTGKYFAQTVKLLKQYHKYNSRINVTFVDPYEPDFSTFSKSFSDLQFAFGDMVVSVGSGDSEKHTAVGFSDIYATESSSYYQTISGNQLESALVKAITSLTGDNVSMNVGILENYCSDSVSGTLTSLLTTNNYSVGTVSGLVVSEIPEDYDAVVIAAPERDMTDAEITALDAFLQNDGKMGKTVIYFASASSPELPKLETFLNEWGVSTESGVLYDTGNYHIDGEPTTIGLKSNNTEYFQNAKSGTLFISGNNVPLSLLFDTHENRSTEAIMSTLATVVVYPDNAADDWIADSSKAESYPAAVAAVNKDGDKKSTLLVFSSDDILNSQWVGESSVGNADMVLSSLVSSVGIENSGGSFTPKTVGSASFTALNTAVVKIFKILFAVLVPLAIALTGALVVSSRRKK